MTQEQKEEMAAVMRDNLPPIDEVENMIAHDIRVLAPLIDRWIREAVEEAQYDAALESNEALNRMDMLREEETNDRPD